VLSIERMKIGRLAIINKAASTPPMCPPPRATIRSLKWPTMHLL
jgi:hypothetical protein